MNNDNTEDAEEVQVKSDRRAEARRDRRLVHLLLRVGHWEDDKLYEQRLPI
jgi:hypothetical protein